MSMNKANNVPLLFVEVLKFQQGGLNSVLEGKHATQKTKQEQ